eukprot:1611-Heterococcus_DN1.PRE.1
MTGSACSTSMKRCDHKWRVLVIAGGLFLITAAVLARSCRSRRKIAGLDLWPARCRADSELAPPRQAAAAQTMATAAGQRLAAADAALAAQRTGAGDRLAEESHLAGIQHPSTATAAAATAAAAAAVQEAANADVATAAMRSCWKKQDCAASRVADAAGAGAGVMSAEAERCRN